MCSLRCCIDKLPEVTIFSDEDSAFAHSYVNDIYVAASRRKLDHSRNVVARSAERPHYAEIAAFIRKKPHSRARFQGERFFMSKRIRCIGDGGLNVTLSEMRIGLKKLALASAITKLAQDKFNCDSSPANDGLSEHHFRIDLNSVMRRGGFEPNKVTARAGSHTECPHAEITPTL
jgi:hypothetical protein